jgi:hypothetical protein
MSKKKPIILPTDRQIITGHPDTKVELKLQMDDKTRQAWILVSVASNARRGLWGHHKVDANEHESKLEGEVARWAMRIAAYQCEQYGDMHDPASAAKAAKAALADIMAKAHRANKKVISVPK